MAARKPGKSTSTKKPKVKTLAKVKADKIRGGRAAILRDSPP